MYLFTSEAVTEGHPDKICDKIADAVLDAALKEDPNSRVACEVSVTDRFCLIYGEITTKANLDYKKIAEEVIKEIGYNDLSLGYDYKNVEYLVKIKRQSPDISMGVDKEDQGAGDQGIMFGYATNETSNYMPLAIDLANKLAKRLEYCRKENIIKDLGPDGKTQVTIKYDKAHKPLYIDSIVLSTQHRENKSLDSLKGEIIEKVFKDVLPKKLLSDRTKYYINPTGRFVIGGPLGDAGLTGRKLICDTYGGYSRHGGGAMSGKDSSKVDRSAAYMARYVAKNVVASGICEKCEIQLAYAIGVSEPVSIYLTTFNTNKVPEDKILEVVKKTFDFRPKKIIEKLNLKSPIFSQTAAYGHFGKKNLPWEQLDQVEVFEELLNEK